MKRLGFLMLFPLTACTSITPIGGDGSSGSSDDGDGSTSIIDPSGTGTTNQDSATTFEPTTVGDASTSTGGEGTTGSSGVDSVGFIEPTGDVCSDLPPGTLGHCSRCSPFDQRCAEGDACNPWANDGGEAWNGTRCSPVSDDPDQPGETCQVEGSGVSGVHSCDFATLCWNVDADTNEGECVAMCGGSYEAPECDEGSTCLIANDGVLALCLPACDPLAPSCAEGLGCYPSSNEAFACMREGDAIYVQSSTQHTACPPGSFALDEETCVSFCDLTAETPCEKGQTCTPYFKSDAPEDYANVGACL